MNKSNLISTLEKEERFEYEILFKPEREHFRHLILSYFQQEILEPKKLEDMKIKLRESGLEKEASDCIVISNKELYFINMVENNLDNPINRSRNRIQSYKQKFQSNESEYKTSFYLGYIDISSTPNFQKTLEVVLSQI
jgi:hypothetical protein